MDDLIENPEDASAEKQSAAKKSTLVSVAVNLTLTVSQVFAGLLSGSQGLIADGIHSLTDLIADFVVLFANHHSAKDADEDHHYGHQRYETAASLFLGISLLVVALGMLWSAGHKIVNPIAASQISILALYVALGSLVAKELLFRYMLAVAKRVRSSMLVANAWHARSDAASSLVVSVGIVGALLGFPILDSVGALIVGLMIIRTGWSFSWDALNDLMDRAVSEEEHQHIEKIILSTEGVLGCHDLRTRKMGDMILVDVHIEVDANATVQVGHDIALTAANQVKAELPVLNVMTHIDPI
ncbi:cation transporter [Polynucleobacter paneuropaeus]|jgi:cation diffusion facilitator family transporter|uniref:Cation transporter n=1 Tax=Polynucleobacter paneuropaeus TaxID=2527775 RepID=A0A9Q2WJT6_9BURK|nr:cation diffusion facilitator family transporter [Polynucleobacter paneuropaeus]AWW47503.1 cation-efflux pump [Polynucleobacter paneuropaeus]MBT8519946.1 cation transporter [Polynucleobacter paneuropaeus]MBT8523682.1 cation transporter [Polynucleobacter paneuropaeus]MBT8542225.1 cation transporter [Polynucleobacter paneuropaeus]MBT8546268.1 cation transporter [Polynucleobacter paneuropaeus]